DGDAQRIAHGGEPRRGCDESSVRAAGAAAARVTDGLVTLGFGAFFHLEGVAAAAGRGRVRVVDREARRLDRVDPVDLGALQVGGAERVDDDLDAVELELVVAFLRAAVEAEAVLEAGAAAALDRHAEHGRFALGLVGHELLDLDRGALGQRDQRGARDGALLNLQRLSSSLSAAVSDGSNAVCRPTIPVPGGL